MKYIFILIIIIAFQESSNAQENWNRQEASGSIFSFMFPQAFTFENKTNTCYYSGTLETGEKISYYHKIKEIDFDTWLENSYTEYEVDPDSIEDSLKTPLYVYKAMLNYVVENRVLDSYEEITTLPASVKSGANINFLTDTPEGIVYTAYRIYFTDNTIFLFTVEGFNSNYIHLDVVRNAFFNSIALISP